MSLARPRVVYGLGPDHHSPAFSRRVLVGSAPRHAEAPRRFAALAGGRASAGLVVCRSAREGRLPAGGTVLPWRDFADRLAARP